VCWCGFFVLCSPSVPVILVLLNPSCNKAAKPSRQLNTNSGGDSFLPLKIQKKKNSRTHVLTRVLLYYMKLAYQIHNTLYICRS
jgi:hypothetical protein